MIEQTEANSNATSASTKFRIIMIELEKQRGVASGAPNPSVTSSSIGANVPDQTVLKRFLRLYLDYSQERSLSSKWAGAYQPLINAHFDAAEAFEHAQLIAEIGIVLASLAVLLSNRPAWLAALGFAAICIALISVTALNTSHKVARASQRVEHEEEAYKDLRMAHMGTNEDEATVEMLDPGGKIRVAMQER